jgi:hypothetical protein
MHFGIPCIKFDSFYNIVFLSLVVSLEVESLASQTQHFVTIIYLKFVHAIVQVVSCWLPTAAALVQAQGRSCRTCGGQSCTGACFFQVQSNLSSWTPRIMNNSVYEQIFRTQSVSDDVLCLKLWTRKPSTSWSYKLGVSASAVFLEEWSRPIGESVSCCVAFVHLNSLCLLLYFSVFCVFL